ncbi:hypothetical protein FRC20_004927 [Serendipita sp. 405]|nr:hypothetical protein FRC18_009700 [Serendipita sp. 400]KAG8841613.1 hypothetical protein FRC20_004927 [Serendipita sp. 405]
MSTFSFVRLLLLGLVWAISIVVLGIAANSIALSVAVVWSYPIVALVVAILTHVISTPMVIISLAKPGAKTSRVIVEFSWVIILWLLWLFVAITTSSMSVFSAGCGVFRSLYGDDAASQCLQFSALRGCAWANTVTLFVYAVHLLALSILTNSRNRGIATSTNAFLADASLLRFSVLTNKQPSFIPPTSTSRDIEKMSIQSLPTYPSKAYDVNLTNRSSYVPMLKPFESSSSSSNPHAFWAEAQRVSSLSSLTLPKEDQMALKSTTRPPTMYTPSVITTPPRRQHSNRSVKTSRSSSSQGSSRGSSHGSNRGSVYRTYAPSPLGQVQPVILTSERRYPN